MEVKEIINKALPYEFVIVEIDSCEYIETFSLRYRDLFLTKVIDTSTKNTDKRN